MGLYDRPYMKEGYPNQHPPACSCVDCNKPYKARGKDDISFKIPTYGYFVRNSTSTICPVCTSAEVTQFFTRGYGVRYRCCKCNHIFYIGSKRHVQTVVNSERMVGVKQKSQMSKTMLYAIIGIGIMALVGIYYAYAWIKYYVSLYRAY
jgi:hypothetical protein